jgi:hypothetical protein
VGLWGEWVCIIGSSLYYIVCTLWDLQKEAGLWTLDTLLFYFATDAYLRSPR